jgi:protein-disulfide isomerase
MSTIARTPVTLIAISLLALSGAARAAADGSRLQLPEGADVALVVFEDLQCPDCRKEHPRLLASAAANDVPLVVHDFPIQRHKWAFPAAVLARHFGSISPELGAQFRSYVFQNQPGVGVDNIRWLGEQFAARHGVSLPAELDADGKLAAQVQADYDLGKRIGLEYVPLIFVLGRGETAPRWAEVADTSMLDLAIAQMRQKARAVTPP